jgi:hypothetical protein
MMRSGRIRKQFLSRSRCEISPGGLFDRDHALGRRNETAQIVEHRRFAGAGSAADDDVRPRADRRDQKVRHIGRQASQPHHIVEQQRLGFEPANRQRRPAQRQRGDHGVEARSVGQLRVNHRRDFVDAPAGAADQPLNESQQVLVVGEGHVGRLQQAVPFDVDVLRAVHQHVAHVRIVHQRLQRAERVDLVHDLLHHGLAILRGQLQFFERAQVRGQRAQLPAQFVFLQFARFRQVDRIDHLPVQLVLQKLKFPAPGNSRKGAWFGNHEIVFLWW